MNAYRHAASAALAMSGHTPQGRLLPGLPATRLPGNRNRVGLSSPNLGATVTNLNGMIPTVVQVGGAPSIQMKRRDRGGVTTTVQRSSPYTDFLTTPDINLIRVVARKIVADAEASSQGPLTTAILRKRGHPYGRGRRQGLGRIQGRQVGVSNLTIINSQSGALAKRWSYKLNVYKSGIDIDLINTKRYAGYLAFGTSKMKAHGPFTSSIVKHLAELNQVWLQTTRQAYLRYQATERFYRKQEVYGWQH